MVLYRSHDLDHNHLNRLLRRKLSVSGFFAKPFWGRGLNCTSISEGKYELYPHKCILSELIFNSV